MKTFQHVLQEHRTENPEKTAAHLLFSGQPDQRLSYEDLVSGSLGYAQKLSGKGVQPGEVVVLILDHGPDLLFAFFGTVLLGAIPAIMPFLTEKLSPEQYRASLKSLFEITRPAGVITSPDFAPEVQTAMDGDSPLRAVIENVDVRPGPEISIPSLPGWAARPTDIVLLQHSSGTTGLQKGVALSHQAVFNQLASYSQAIRLSGSDVIVSWLPLYHDMGLIAGFLMPILCGVPLVLLSPFDWVRAPHRLLHAVSEYRGTLSWLPNFAYNFCAQKIRNRFLQDLDLSSWRAVINCSEPMYLDSHRLFAQRFEPFGLQASALATCYAMAENVFAVTQGGIDRPVVVDTISKQAYESGKLALQTDPDETPLHFLSAGRAIADNEVQIWDDQRRPLPDRQIGEICLRSNAMLTEYYRRPDLTAAAFHRGWYLTGDLGYLLQGELFVTGRKKDLIIVGGKNIFPQDIERMAYSVPGVHPGRAVAFGIFDEGLGTEEVVVIVETDEQGSGPRLQLADQIRRTVTQGSAVALRRVEVVDRGWLLKTSSGKIARGANRSKYLKAIDP